MNSISRRFHSFVVLAAMRTGSNLLEANLNALPGVKSYGDVFNPHFVGKKDQTELFGVTLEERDVNPKPLLRKMRNETEGLSGFRFFHDHDTRVLDIVLADPACAKIILTRNPLESYVSWKIARATGQWKLMDAKRLRSSKVRFEADEFRDQIADLGEFYHHLLRNLQKSGQTAYFLDYEDLLSVDVLNGLAVFLGVEGGLKAVDDTLKKQNPGTIEDNLENPEDLRAAVASVDFFGLNKIPTFEPRRAAGVPTAVASASARLLFLPIRSGPVSNVKDWLSGFGPLEEGFEQKTLRQWKRNHPNHRSFTVIRHPLLRAHVAFREMVLSGLMPDLRRMLVRAYKAELPATGEAFQDVAAERAAFLVFLNFARLATGGQTGNRVDPNIASQTALVQGFAAFQPLDLVIREDRLAEGLAFLLAETGGAALRPKNDDGHDEALRAIHDDRLEAAAADAYARDYAGFGLGRWLP